MGESQTNGRTDLNVAAAKPEDSSAHKAARYGRYSLITSTCSWFFLLLFITCRWDIYSAAWIFWGLLLVALTSFVAGFAGLYAKGKKDIAIAVVGILLSGSFGFCDFFAIALNAVGHSH